MTDTPAPGSSRSAAGAAPKPLLAWKAEYALGIPGVDSEHRELMDLINRLHAQLLDPGAGTGVMDFLGELFAKISSHFALEEKLMRDGGYAAYPAHKADHERLLDEIRDLMDDYEDGEWVDLEGFGGRLEQWFSVHFSDHDARLHQWSSPVPG